MIIYRSSNTPIVIEFNTNIDSINELQICLYSDTNYSTLIQKWNKKDVLIQNEYLIIPLTQKETSQYPVGIAHLELKQLDENGFIIFSDSYPVVIKAKNNLDILGDDEQIDYSNTSIEKNFIKSITNDIIMIKDTDFYIPISNEEISSWFDEE